jgi:hypothetical protein
MTPDLARLTFAAFPPELKAAMKTAAARNQWQAEDWPRQIEMLQDAMRQGHSADALANAYSNPPVETL